MKSAQEYIAEEMERERQRGAQRMGQQWTTGQAVAGEAILRQLAAQQEPPEVIVLRAKVRELEDRLAEMRAEAARLRETLQDAYTVMNHLGDVLNGMDCVAEVEVDGGVSNAWIDKMFERVRAALCDAPPSYRPVDTR